ncbi:MAG TPA: glycosyltransferase [Trebonia sp.]|jgi:UDP-glucose:tetrahydrobiopterin glucosyltransferase|nr:glycosyltransferase [Trebonia sp.]
MKIAIMAPLVTAIREPQLGGSQAFVADLARGLVGRGHDVHVYAASGSRIEGVELIDTGVDPRALAGTLYRAFGSADSSAPAAEAAGAAEAAFATAFAAVRSGRYDVIHNHAFDAPAVRFATGLPAPVVHTLHLPPDKAVSAALREAARPGSTPPLVAVVSRSQAQAWRQVAHVDAVLPPYPSTRDIPWSATAGHGALFAGRLSPEKGAAEAIDIARTAGVPIQLYGDVYDERYTKEQIDPRRAWPGVDVREAVPRAELWQAMAGAAVVLCPARWDEPFGLAAAEAQACGTPVVAFSRGGLREVIVDGATGFLVPPDDVPAAAEAVSKAAGISRSACRDHAVGHLDLGLSLDAHERLYRRAGEQVST